MLTENNSGFGTRMVNTHSVIMWKNDDGTTTLSHRYADTYSEPHVVAEPPRVATIVEPKKNIVCQPYFIFAQCGQSSLLAGTPRAFDYFRLSNTCKSHFVG